MTVLSVERRETSPEQQAALTSFLTDTLRTIAIYIGFALLCGFLFTCGALIWGGSDAARFSTIIILGLAGGACAYVLVPRWRKAAGENTGQLDLFE